jgi:hypothetical protein
MPICAGETVYQPASCKFLREPAALLVVEDARELIRPARAARERQALDLLETLGRIGFDGDQRVRDRARRDGEPDRDEDDQYGRRCTSVVQNQDAAEDVGRESFENRDGGEHAPTGLGVEQHGSHVFLREDDEAADHDG